MKANIAFDQNSTTENQNEKKTVDQILVRIARVSRSDDGKCLSFTDYFGKTLRVRISNKGVNDGKIVLRTTTSSGCGCVYEHFCGMTVLVDPNTGEPCSH